MLWAHKYSIRESMLPSFIPAELSRKVLLIGNTVCAGRTKLSLARRVPKIMRSFLFFFSTKKIPYGWSLPALEADQYLVPDDLDQV